MAGVPGTVGGALAMNAGCYGGETWSHVIAAETVDRNGNIRMRRPTDYHVGYRHLELRDGGGRWLASRCLRKVFHGDEMRVYDVEVC